MTDINTLLTGMEEKIYSEDEETAIKAVVDLDSVYKHLLMQGINGIYPLNKSIDRLNEKLSMYNGSHLTEDVAILLFQTVPVSIDVLANWSSRCKDRSVIEKIVDNLTSQQRLADDSNCSIEGAISLLTNHGYSNAAIKLIDAFTKSWESHSITSSNLLSALLDASLNGDDILVNWAKEHQDALCHPVFVDKADIEVGISLYEAGLQEVGRAVVKRTSKGALGMADLHQCEHILGKSLMASDLESFKSRGIDVNPEAILIYVLASHDTDLTINDVPLTAPDIVDRVFHLNVTRKCPDEKYFSVLKDAIKLTPMDASQFRTLYNNLENAGRNFPVEVNIELLRSYLDKFGSSLKELPFFCGKCSKYGFEDLVESETSRINVAFVENGKQVAASFFGKMLKIESLAGCIDQEVLKLYAEHHLLNAKTHTERRMIMESLPQDVVMRSNLLKRHMLNMDMGL